MRALVIVAILVGGCSYTPGSFDYPARRFPGQRLTVGCLDLSIDRRPDMIQAAVLDYQFGNRCDESVVVDLVHVTVTGRTSEGEEVSLEPFDPGAEMAPLRLAGRQAGGEAIAYPAPKPLAQVCADAASINPNATEQRWVCFGSHERPVERSTIAEVSP